ncbi:hypothetical protein TorRG33x02_181960 [Trema orientale]|uniref:Uncharacterized protein n=1 Tax=Trema orientale TaxID=63057 RepID=A0A2P5EKC3_TREOI|nr:hypothetical protein TorRG33x02_181960 [Trema orientale]
MSACQYCMSSGAHRHHKVLKIYRHVYKDVVSLSAMEKFVDCSQIQWLNPKLSFSQSMRPRFGKTRPRVENTCLAKFGVLNSRSSILERASRIPGLW